MHQCNFSIQKELIVFSEVGRILENKLPDECKYRGINSEPSNTIVEVLTIRSEHLNYLLLNMGKNNCNGYIKFLIRLHYDYNVIRTI